MRVYVSTCVFLLDLDCARLPPRVLSVLFGWLWLLRAQCPILLQVQGGCYTISPGNLCLPFILCRSPHLLISSASPLRVSLQRACDSCKTLYQGVDLRCAALSSPFSTPSSIPPRFSPSTLCWSVTPPLLGSTGPLCCCNVAICSWWCGADNSLFYLPLSSTKGPRHWSNASRLMAAQQAAFYARDTA